MEFKEFLLQERLYERIGPGYGDNRDSDVYIDPTIDELLRCGKKIRGILEGPHMFIWRYEGGFHEDIMERLQLQADHKFYMYLQPNNRYLYVKALGPRESNLAYEYIMQHPQLVKLQKYIFPDD